MQESRLFKIVYYLLENGRVTANILADKFEVSVRTIYRDVDRLSSVGIPIFCIKGKGGGIFLLENYILNKELISKEEQFAILSSLQGFSSILPNQEKEVINKLNAIFKNDIKDWIELDFSNWGLKTKENEKFKQIREAILKKYIISFIYMNSKGEKSERKVKPLKIHFKFKYWYLQAYCIQKEDLRFFKINRMSSLETQNEKFEDEYILKEIDFDKIDYQNIPIKLRFDRNVEHRVYDEFDIDSIIKEDVNSITIQISIPQDDWLIGYLMSFCGGVEILSPKSLKEEFEYKVGQMYKKYL